MRNLRAVAALAGRFTLACAGVHAALAGPIGLANLHTLAAQADAVLVGTVVQGQQTGRDVSFVVAVDRVLKGGVVPLQNLTVQWTSPSAVNGSRNLQGRNGMYFLRLGEGGAWQLLPVMAGDVVFDLAALPVAPGPALAGDLRYSSKASTDEKLALELAAAIENQQGALAIDYLDAFDSEGALGLGKVYLRFAQSASSAIQAHGFAGLIRQGDVPVLSRLLAELPAIGGGAPGDRIANALCRYQNGNPVAVAALGELSAATAGFPRIQFCAAAALRAIHTKETLGYLDRLLDSPDPQVRYEAVAGLASFANSGSLPREAPLTIDGNVSVRPASQYKSNETLSHFPTVDIFRTSESTYISFWKSWWATVQPQLK